MRIKEIIKEYRKRIIKKEKEKEIEEKREKREWRRVSPRRGKENGVESAHADPRVWLDRPARFGLQLGAESVHAEFEHIGIESGHADVWAADVVDSAHGPISASNE